MATILLIDDDELVRITVRRILESASHTVIEARNGNEGLELVRAVPLDLIITDIIMPEREGIETIMEIRKLNTKIGIVAISGGGRAQAMDFLPLARKLGADQILRKPFSPDELLEVTDLTLRGTIL